MRRLLKRERQQVRQLMPPRAIGVDRDKTIA